MRVVNETRGEILIYEQIGEGFFTEGMTAKRFAEDLKALGNINDLDVRINSPGGNVFDGQAIYSQLKAHQARVTVYIDGIAASIASVIAMAGDTIIMPDNALMMIHDPSGLTWGTADDMRKTAEALDKIKETIVAAYKQKAGDNLSDDDIRQLMSDETWMTADEAIAWGFADEKGEEIDMDNLMTNAAQFLNILSCFTNTPEPLRMSAAAAAVRLDQGQLTRGNAKMPIQNTKDPALSERRRIQEIRAACAAAKLGDDIDLINLLINSGLSIEKARTAIVNKLAENAGSPTPGVHIMDLNNCPDTQVKLMAQVLAARYGGPAPSNEAREYSSLRVVDMARKCLELAGVRTTGMNASKIIMTALHSTSDFPELLQETGNRSLRQAYQTYDGGIRRISRKITADDFRAITRIQMSMAPELLPVGEHGEFKYGTVYEGKERYRLSTFGRIFGITRQALINDDLGAFVDFGRKMGLAAAEHENEQLAALLISNPVMDDQVATFHANHNNLSNAAVISIESLGSARMMMRLQKDINPNSTGRIINVTPKYLLTPATLETVAEQYLAQLMATLAENVNPFGGRLELVVDPRLDASSTTAWYLTADPNLIDGIEYAHLQDQEGPYIEAREGFKIDGVEIKVRLDFGAGIVDYRGLHKNPGA